MTTTEPVKAIFLSREPATGTLGLGILSQSFCWLLLVSAGVQETAEGDDDDSDVDIDTEGGMNLVLANPKPLRTREALSSFAMGNSTLEPRYGSLEFGPRKDSTFH